MQNHFLKMSKNKKEEAIVPRGTNETPETPVAEVETPETPVAEVETPETPVAEVETPETPVAEKHLLESSEEVGILLAEIYKHICQYADRKEVGFRKGEPFHLRAYIYKTIAVLKDEAAKYQRFHKVKSAQPQKGEAGNIDVLNAIHKAAPVLPAPAAPVKSFKFEQSPAVVADNTEKE
jgi:hypothetical protein